MDISHRRTRAHIDWQVLAVSYALAIFGIIDIAIASYDPDKGTHLSLLNCIVNSNSASWQSIFTLASLVVVVVVTVPPFLVVFLVVVFFVAIILKYIEN